MVVCFFSCWMKPGPKVRLGTKCPSITSRCSMLMSDASNRRTCSPMVVRSDAMMDGDIKILFCSVNIDSHIFYFCFILEECDYRIALPAENEHDFMAGTGVFREPDPLGAAVLHVSLVPAGFFIIGNLVFNFFVRRVGMLVERAPAYLDSAFFFPFLIRARCRRLGDNHSGSFGVVGGDDLLFDRKPLRPKEIVAEVAGLADDSRHVG